ncbi:uncharacterized protein LOC131956938, partial [Physella acuta]|uniref:uncharacterized protein LOC131956938 n=1 Tax=Physella acuta TaxID=109671 RepID=UPI0027DD243D
MTSLLVRGTLLTWVIGCMREGQAQMDTRCESPTLPEPCNLQVIYPDPIGITACYATFEIGDRDTVVRRAPKIRAALKVMPVDDVLIYMIDMDTSKVHWVAEGKVREDCLVKFHRQVI